MYSRLIRREVHLIADLQVVTAAGFKRLKTGVPEQNLKLRRAAEVEYTGITETT